MKICITTFLRRIAQIMITKPGSILGNILTEAGKRRKDLVDKSKHFDMAKEYGQKAIDDLEKMVGHGLSQEAFDKFKNKTEKYMKNGDIIGLLSYFKNFMLAWKAPTIKSISSSLTHAP